MDPEKFKSCTAVWPLLVPEIPSLTPALNADRGFVENPRSHFGDPPLKGAQKVVRVWLCELKISRLLKTRNLSQRRLGKMTSPLEHQADDGGGLTISSMVKEFQGLKDKFKREDADSRELTVHISPRLKCYYSLQLPPSPTLRRRQYCKSAVFFQTRKL